MHTCTYIHIYTLYIHPPAPHRSFFPPCTLPSQVDGHDHAERFDHGHRSGDLEPQQRRFEAGARALGRAGWGWDGIGGEKVQTWKAIGKSKLILNVCVSWKRLENGGKWSGELAYWSMMKLENS